MSASPATSVQTDRTVIQDMLRDIIRALGERPGEPAAQRDSRARAVALSVLAFRPRDPVETLLAGLIVMHAQLLQDAARAASGGDPKARAGVIALGRVLLGFLREMHRAQGRVLETAPRAEEIQETHGPAPEAPPAARPANDPPEPKPRPLRNTPAPVAARTPPEPVSPPVLPSAPAPAAGRTPLSQRPMPQGPIALGPMLPNRGPGMPLSEEARTPRATTSVAAMLAVVSPPAAVRLSANGGPPAR